MFYKPGSFFINVLSLTNTLYSGMKNKLSLGFSDIKKKGEKNYRSLQLSSLATLYSLSIYYSSSTGERAEYITEDEKDSGEGGDSSYERGGDARHLA